MADIEYTQSPEGYQLTTKMAGAGGPGGLGGVPGLLEELLRRKMAQQDQMRNAMVAAAQGPDPGLGGSAPVNRAAQRQEELERQQQEMQLKAMRMQLADQEKARFNYAERPNAALSGLAALDYNAGEMANMGGQRQLDRASQVRSQYGRQYGDVQQGSHNSGPGSFLPAEVNARVAAEQTLQADPGWSAAQKTGMARQAAGWYGKK